MNNKFILVSIILGFFLIAPFVRASSIDGFTQNPNFVPKENWSIKYIGLFKQAVKEKYNVDDEVLNNNLTIISVVKGTKSDGFAIPMLTEKSGRIHFIYKIDWALYNGLGIGFDVQDNSGNELTDQQILANMKENLIPVFTIKNIISKEQARNSCSPQAEFSNLESPWYSNDNNVRFDDRRNELVFYCHKTISVEENKCLTETFSLQSGQKIDSSEGACVVYSAGNKSLISNTSKIVIISIVVILLVIIVLGILFLRRK